MTNCASLFTLECTSVQITWPPTLAQDNTFSLTIIHKRGGGGENNVLLQKIRTIEAKLFFSLALNDPGSDSCFIQWK